MGIHDPAVKVALAGSVQAVHVVGLEHVEHPKGQGTQTLPCIANPALQVAQVLPVVQVAQLA